MAGRVTDTDVTRPGFWCEVAMSPVAAPNDHPRYVDGEILPLMHRQPGRHWPSPLLPSSAVAGALVSGEFDTSTATLERVLDRLRGQRVASVVPVPRARPHITDTSQLTLGIVPDPREVCRVRREVRNVLTAWCKEDRVGDVLVVISELVTNAIRHAPCLAIGLTVTCGDGLVLIEVEDGSASPPILHHVPEAGTEGGRGLGLVQSLTAGWGWTPWGGGAKRVWALLPVALRQPAQAGCKP